MAEVSVVIPTYNRADIIGRTIDSALAQTLSDVEVIVVDDASTDDTLSILESYGDQIKYYCHDENRGGSAARNTGIEASTGEYIAFLDSDDTWKPTKLEKQIQLLERRSDEWIAAYCDFRQKRANELLEIIDNVVRRPTGFEGDDEIITRIFLRTIAHGGASTLVAEHDTVKAIGGFDEAFSRHQDLELLVRLLQRGKLGYIDEVLVAKHDTGNPSPKAAQKAMERFTEKFSDMILDRGLSEDVQSIQRFMAAKFHFNEGELLAGVECLRGAQMPHYRDGLGVLLALSSGIRKHI